jgi:hypothetical protein
MVGIGPGVVKPDLSLGKNYSSSWLPEDFPLATHSVSPVQLLHSGKRFWVTRGAAPTISPVSLEWPRDRLLSCTPVRIVHIQHNAQPSP